MFRKVGLTLVVSLVTVGLFVSERDSDASQSAVSSLQALPEEVLQRNCQECHDLRRIQTSAKSADGWRETIQSMIKDQGAKIPDEEIPALVRYLALNHGPVPEGPGRAILLNTCTMCHDLGRIKTAPRSEEEWEETLIAMLNEGAPLSDAEFPLILHYLAEHYGFD